MSLIASITAQNLAAARTASKPAKTEAPAADSPVPAADAAAPAPTPTQTAPGQKPMSDAELAIMGGSHTVFELKSTNALMLEKQLRQLDESSIMNQILRGLSAGISAREKMLQIIEKQVADDQALQEIMARLEIRGDARKAADERIAESSRTQDAASEKQVAQSQELKRMMDQHQAETEKLQRLVQLNLEEVRVFEKRIADRVELRRNFEKEAAKPPEDIGPSPEELLIIPKPDPLLEAMLETAKSNKESAQSQLDWFRPAGTPKSSDEPDTETSATTAAPTEQKPTSGVRVVDVQQVARLYRSQVEQFQTTTTDQSSTESTALRTLPADHARKTLTTSPGSLSEKKSSQNEKLDDQAFKQQEELQRGRQQNLSSLSNANSTAYVQAAAIAGAVNPDKDS